MKEIEKTKEIEKIEKMIEDVCKETFEMLTDIYKNPDKRETNTRLILPTKRDKTIRLSEQELRLVFIEQLNQNEYFIDKNLSYSIETPTKLKYMFKDQEDLKVVADDDKGGESARIDLVIFDSSGQRKVLIEFKGDKKFKKHYKNGNKDFRKDFFKLINEKEKEQKYMAKYFIQILTIYDDETIKNVNETIMKDYSDDIKYIYYSIKDGNNNLGML